MAKQRATVATSDWTLAGALWNMRCDATSTLTCVLTRGAEGHGESGVYRRGFSAGRWGGRVGCVCSWAAAAGLLTSARQSATL